MYKKFMIPVLIIFVVLFQVANTYAETDGYSSGDISFPDIKRTVTVQRTGLEPVGWPIVKETRTEFYDEKTSVRYIHVTIVREQPVNKSSNLSGCSAENTAYTCVQGSDKYVEDTATISTSNGWIKSHASHWQTKYCRSGETHCQFRKPYKLQIWWTRSNQSWRIENALVRWGCSACLVCEGGSSSYTYNNGPFTPQWSGNTSYYYTYTSSQWPKMDDFDWGAWKAGSDSDAFYGWQKIGQLSTNADG